MSAQQEWCESNAEKAAVAACAALKSATAAGPAVDTAQSKLLVAVQLLWDRHFSTSSSSSSAAAESSSLDSLVTDVLDLHDAVLDRLPLLAAPHMHHKVAPLQEAATERHAALLRQLYARFPAETEARALAFKTGGNDHFSATRYAEAVAAYKCGIVLLPAVDSVSSSSSSSVKQLLSVLYSNTAACHIDSAQAAATTQHLVTGRLLLHTQDPAALAAAAAASALRASPSNDKAVMRLLQMAEQLIVDADALLSKTLLSNKLEPGMFAVGTMHDAVERLQLVVHHLSVFPPGSMCSTPGVERLRRPAFGCLGSIHSAVGDGPLAVACTSAAITSMPSHPDALRPLGQSKPDHAGGPRHSWHPLIAEIEAQTKSRGSSSALFCCPAQSEPRRAQILMDMHNMDHALLAWHFVYLGSNLLQYEFICPRAREFALLCVRSKGVLPKEMQDVLQKVVYYAKYDPACNGPAAQRILDLAQKKKTPQRTLEEMTAEKQRGNELFGNSEFKKAIEIYEAAIPHLDAALAFAEAAAAESEAAAAAAAAGTSLCADIRALLGVLNGNTAACHVELVTRASGESEIDHRLDGWARALIALCHNDVERNWKRLDFSMGHVDEDGNEKDLPELTGIGAARCAVCKQRPTNPVKLECGAYRCHSCRDGASCPACKKKKPHPSETLTRDFANRLNHLRSLHVGFSALPGESSSSSNNNNNNNTDKAWFFSTAASLLSLTLWDRAPLLTVLKSKRCPAFVKLGDRRYTPLEVAVEAVALTEPGPSRSVYWQTLHILLRAPQIHPNQVVDPSTTPVSYDEKIDLGPKLGRLSVFDVCMKSLEECGVDQVLVMCYNACIIFIESLGCGIGLEGGGGAFLPTARDYEALARRQFSFNPVRLPSGASSQPLRNVTDGEMTIAAVALVWLCISTDSLKLLREYRRTKTAPDCIAYCSLPLLLLAAAMRPNQRVKLVDRSWWWSRREVAEAAAAFSMEQGFERHVPVFEYANAVDEFNPIK